MNHTTNWSSSDAGGLCWVSDPHEAYLEAKVDEVGGGVVKATTSDGRPFNIDLKAPLAKPSRGKRAPKEPPRRILQREAVTRANGYNDMDEMRGETPRSIALRSDRGATIRNTRPSPEFRLPFLFLPLLPHQPRDTAGA